MDILYRRYREELLADAEEIAAAEAEGIAFRFLVAPSRALTANGRLRGLECVRIGLGEPDASGRRRPLAIPGSEFTVTADRVLAAVGQRADLEFLPEEFRERLTDGDLLRMDPATAMTPWQGIFAAGDAVSGPATVIEAIAAGHRAASSIRAFLESGRPLVADQRPERRAPVELELPDSAPLEALRARAALAAVRPGREFAEVEGPLSPAAAIAEARRCLRCGPCGECRICASTCRRRHIMMRLPEDGEDGAESVLLRAASSVALNLPTQGPTPGRLLPEAAPRLLPDIGPGEGRLVELLPVRVEVRKTLCRACGECAEVCPFEAVSILEGADRCGTARIEPALCRGCNLCVGVCPTGAATATALSPEWWGSRLADAFVDEAPFVVLACQRRVGSVESALLRAGARIEVIRLRCVGQVHAGMLLELGRRGARGVLLAGCAAERCRFGCGAGLAAEQTERARAMLELLGGDPETLRTDWSPDRAGDPLAAAVLQMVAVGLASERAEAESMAH